MERDRFARLDALFHLALDTPPAQRAEVLHRACGDDDALRHEVEALLAADNRAPELTCLLAAEEAPDPTELPGYRILRRIGAGGMGRVFEAEQLEPPRRVAVKVLHRLGSDARVRLRQEAALLARLRHKNVAQIYAADTHGDTPFLVMELVEGERLDGWVARHRPNRVQRVELLVQVCRAVEHAHRQGVVHRDLKPANVMVDAEGQVKVLDFGIAAATQDPTAEPAGGTLGYISPEQLRSGWASIDPRVDVYSIGVIAFEVLANRSPFQLAGRTAAELAGIVARGPEVPLGALDRELRGDLEAIVAHAIAADPEQRYSAVALLGADLERFLRRQPVSVRAPHLRYLALRFAQRHRALVGTAAFALAALVAGLGISLVLLARTTTAESAERAARGAAEAEVDVTREFAGLIESILVAPNHNHADPEPGSRVSDVKVVEVLDEFARDLGQRTLRPAAELAIRQVLGGTYLSLGAIDQAIAQLTRASELPPGEALDGQRRQAQALGNLAMALGKKGQHDAAVASAQRAVAIAREAKLSGSAEASAVACLARALERAGRHQEIAGALAATGPDSGDGDDEHLGRRVAAARELTRVGKAEEALSLLDALREGLRKRPAAAGVRQDHAIATAVALQRLGRSQEAIDLLLGHHREVAALLGTTHGRTLEISNRMGIAMVEGTDYRSARAVLEEAVAAVRAAGSPASLSFAFVLRTLSVVELHEYQPAAAATQLAASLEVMRQCSEIEDASNVAAKPHAAQEGSGAGPGERKRQRDELEVRRLHAHYLWLAGQPAAARRELEDLVQIYDDGHAPVHGVEVHKVLGLVLAELGEVDAALAHFQRARERGEGPPPNRLLAEIRFALSAAGRADLAPQSRRSDQPMRGVLQPIPLLSMRRYLQLGNAELVAKSLRSRLDGDPAGTHAPYAFVLLATALADLEQHDEAKAALAQARQLLAQEGRRSCDAIDTAIAALSARTGY